MTAAGNEPLVIWAQSEAALMRALAFPQPVAVLIAFKISESQLREIAAQAGFNLSETPIHNAAAPLAGCIYFSVEHARDRNADDSRSADEIALSELRLHDIFHNTSDAFFIYDVLPGNQLRLVKVNPAGEKLTGISAAEFCGKKVEEIFPAETVRLLYENLQKCIAAGDTWEFERPLLGDPQRGTFHNMLIVGRDENGNIRRLIGMSRNVSERSRVMAEINTLNETLERRAAELAESNAELERFAYVASHDLQEPLRMVTSFLNLLKKRYAIGLDDTAQQYIGFAVEGAERMKRLINDLLEYSRAGSNKEDSTQVDLNMLLFDVINMFSETIKKTGGAIDTGNLPTVSGKKVQLMQLFQNLVGNALKYRSRMAPEIKISWSETATYWQFCVRDNGIGIDPKFSEKIFIIFQRLHSKSDYSGSGIGLAICKKIVERHGGRMWVESEPGKGSAFYFTLAK
jgi:PAS domain S-box-containing protein